MARMESDIAAAIASEPCLACGAAVGGGCVNSRYAVHSSRLIAARLAGRDPGDEDHPDILTNIAATDRWLDSQSRLRGS